jgi:hypothetical protein
VRVPHSGRSWPRWGTPKKSFWPSYLGRLSSIKAEEAPTLPLTEKEDRELLATVRVSFPDSKKRLRVRALVRMMRHPSLPSETP